MAKFVAAAPPLSAENVAAQNVGAAVAGGIAIKTLTVEVGTETVVPTIVRGGKEITPPSFNTARIDDFLSHATTLPRLLIPVGISQSIPAGTLVPKGTPVDVVLAPMSSIPFGLLDQFHDDLKAVPITNVLPLLSDPQVAPILQKASASDLTADEKTIVTNQLKTLNVTVDDTNPAKTFALAFDSLKSAQAFQ
jgi:hypothetical protein